MKHILKGWRLVAAVTLIASVPVLGARSVNAEEGVTEPETTQVVPESTVVETTAPAEIETQQPAEPAEEEATQVVTESKPAEVTEEEPTDSVETDPIVEDTAPVDTTTAPAEETEAPAVAEVEAAPAPAEVAIAEASRNQYPKKVFVCKYVGKPGEDERLQTGQNPISVSVNAIPDFQGVGSYFADAQGRSYVLAFDEGQPKPNVSKCPKPDQRQWSEPEYPAFNPLPCVEYRLEKYVATWTVANGWSAWTDWPDAGPLNWGVIPDPRTGHHGGTHGKDGDRHFAYIVVDQRPITTGECRPIAVPVEPDLNPPTCAAPGELIPFKTDGVKYVISGPVNATIVTATPLDGNRFDPDVPSVVYGPYDLTQLSPDHPDCAVPEGYFISFCTELLLVNDGNVDLTFYIGESDEGISVPAGESRSASIEDFGNGVSVTAYFGDQLVFEGTAKLPPPCIPPSEWEAPSHEVVCDADDVITVPEDTDEVAYTTETEGDVTTVKAVWKGGDNRVLQTWTFTDSRTVCPIPVVPADVVFTDPTCAAPQGTFTVTETEGVLYRDKATGQIVLAGVHPATGTVTIEAEAEGEPYYLAKSYNWVHTFKEVPSKETCNPTTTTQPKPEEPSTTTTPPTTNIGTPPVTTNPPSQPEKPVPVDELPKTGGNSMGIILLAGGILGLGLATLGFAKFRRRRFI